MNAARAKRKRRRRVAWFAAVALVALVLVFFSIWCGRPRSGEGRPIEITWDPGLGAWSGSSLLAAAGIVEDRTLFAALLAVAGPLVAPEPGAHLLTDDLTPFEVLRRLVRLSSRARARVVVPEGFNRFQIGERLERLRVCSNREFQAVATERAKLSVAGVDGDTAEGFLFPATYDLHADSTPDAILLELTEQTKKRLVAAQEAHAAAFAALEDRYGWTLREVLTLASVLEKEAARADELPIIASVFFNRLDSAEFRPARSLQSDPTAAYGCLVQPGLASCAGYTGKVTPQMLRDFANPYNTYRHPGLPPGPICNPGMKAVEAVLAPAQTDFLFFVASPAGDGRHLFSRTLEEHDAAVKRPR